MPVNEKILYSKQYMVRRDILGKLFPDAKFLWVKKEDMDNYQTTDGMHLSYNSAIRFVKIMKQYINE